MTDHTETRLRRKRKSQAGKRNKVRLCLLVILLFSGSGAMLYHLDRFSGPGVILNWLRQNNPVEVITAAPSSIRGNIYDRSFRPLAATYKTYAICARPLEMEDPDFSAGILAEILGLKKSKLLQSLKNERGFIWIAKDIDQQTAETVKQKNIKGIYQIVETNRYYPNHDTAAHAVGFVENGHGLDGIEFRYNSVLRGGEISAAELESLNFNPEARFGKSRTHLALSLDLMLQAKIESFLEKRIKITGAASAAAILMNARTGELYALASFPSFNPNRYWEFPSTALKNHALTEPVYPGDLALIFQQAAAFNILNDKKDNFAGEPDEMPALTIITPERKKRRRSSVAPPVDYVEPEYLARFAELLGFDKMVATDLPLKDETPASLSLALTNNSFNSSALRLLNGFTALVNGGILVTPHLLYGAYQKDNFIPLEISRDISSAESVINPGTSKDLRDFLAEKWLRMPRRNLLTGSPMILEAHHFVMRPEDPDPSGSNDADKMSAIQVPQLDQTVMLGAIPGRDPRLTMIAVLSYPDKYDEVFHNVMENHGKAFSLLNPDQDMIQKMLHVTAIDRPEPGPGFWDTEMTLLAQNLYSDRNENINQAALSGELDRTMPDVTGKSLRAGLQVLQHFNLDIKLVGSGRIRSQQPAAGTKLTDVSECILEMRHEI